MRIFFIVLLLGAAVAHGQVREILITDTAYISHRIEDDSTSDFSFKKSKNLKGRWIAFYDELKKHKAVEATFKNGRLIGTEKQWYVDGQLKSESTDPDSASSWNYKKWLPDGKLYMDRKCVNDTCTIEYFYENGILMERDIEAYNEKGDRDWFYSITFCDNGQAKFSPPFNPDSPDLQLVTAFYCSGVRKEEFTLMKVENEFLKIGYYREWYENGGVKTMGYFDEAHPGVKTGTWHYNSEDSKLIRQEQYENGKLTESLSY